MRSGWLSLAVLLSIGSALFVPCASTAAVSLVVNGDFSAGNTGFSSDYTFSPGNILNAATYCIDTDPHNCHSGAASFGDHTTGSGLMMVLNGSGNSTDRAWEETVAVAANARYTFSMWVASWSTSSPARLQVLINGEQVGADFTAPSLTGEWALFTVPWDSGTNTSATISIVDANTAAGGNDFALDDISLVPLAGVPTFSGGGLLLSAAGLLIVGARLVTRQRERP
jgi:hypothetical protein